MKIFCILFRIIIILFISVAIFSCKQEETISMSERVDQFISDINNNQDSAWQNFHPDSTSREATKNYDTTLENHFPKNEDYSIGSKNISSNVVTTPIDSTTSYDSVQDELKFYMKEDGTDYWTVLKLEIYDDGSLVYTYD